MNHAITLGGLLLGVGALTGFGMVVLGVMNVLANSMSDNPTDNSSTAGCVPVLAGAALMITCIVRLLV